MTTAPPPERYRPAPSGRFAADLTSSDDTSTAVPSGTADPDAHAPEPKASPRARAWTVVVGLVFLAVAGVTVRDILLLNGTLSGEQLLAPVFDWFATVHVGPWTLWAGVGCALVALFFLAVTVRPRRRTHMSFGRGSELYARPVDVARLSTAAARRIPGVLSARTVTTRKKIAVTVVTAVTPESADTIRDRVTTQVSELSALLDPSPGVEVTVTRGGETA
jgi:hypothetical protein